MKKAEIESIRDYINKIEGLFIQLIGKRRPEINIEEIMGLHYLFWTFKTKIISILEKEYKEAKE